MKPDILITILLIIIKLTILPSIPWIIVAIPFLISFGIGFIHGVLQGMEDKNK